MKILVVCYGNACRSPMLMALLRRAFDSMHLTDITVESAGIKEEMAAAPSANAFRTMEEMGLDLSKHKPRHLRDVPNLYGFDRIYCMEDGQAAAIKTTGVSADRVYVVNADKGGIPNPYQCGMEMYRECARALTEAAQSIAEEIEALKHPIRIDPP